jgi:hypothetical protein
MRLHTVILPLLAALATALAEPSSPLPASGSTGQTPREAALDNLLSERGTVEALDAAIAEARKTGVSDQAILEARFLYHIDRREDQAIAAMLPEFLKQRESFKLEDSAIFAVKEDWLAVIEYVQAIDSLEKGDKAAFKTHITEAFWLSPRQASAFTPHIERMRLEETMRAVKLDLGTKFPPLVSADPVALDSLISGKKALLLHFWSPLSPECEAAMPDFAATAATLATNGIAVASLVSDDTPKLLTDARAMIHPLGEKPPGAWLIDSKEKPIGRELRIQTLPAFVLVSPEGKIIYNGDPTEDEFWDALKKIDDHITRPASSLKKDQ